MSGDTSSHEAIHYRQTAWQRTLPFVIIPVFSCAEAAYQLWGPQPSAAYARSAAEQHKIIMVTYAVIAFAVLVLVVGFLWSGAFGITLTPTEARVRGLRRRTIRWSAVHAVSTENKLGTRFVVLHEANRRTRLRAPISGFLMRDRDFERKYETIGQWWLEHREPAGQASPTH